MLEREMTRTAVSNLISGARAGHGGALFVAGEAGLGKTRILDEARKLACPDLRIGWARGDVTETSLPFGLVATALDAVDGPRDLLDAKASLGPRDAQGARLGGVLRWLKTTATKPVLLVFDDLHWADPDSLDLVSFLVRRITNLPVAVLAAQRPWPPAANELATALAYDGYAAVYRLAPLSSDAAGQLLAARLGSPVSGAVSRTALELSGGNPLLVEQVAAAIGRGERIGAPTQAGTAAVRAKIVLTRFAGVPKSALRCARAASVLGTRFRPELAVRVAQLDDMEADTALDALCRSGLVRSQTETAAEFVHPLFRQALYDDLAGPVRARLHARAFSELTARGLHDEALDHAARADLAGDDVALEAMTRAGMAALRSGPPTLAARHLQAAVSTAGNRADADLLLALAESLLLVGRPGEVIRVCDRLCPEPELTLVQQVRALGILGCAFSTVGSHSKSTTCFTQAVELAESDDPALAIAVLVDAALASYISAGPASSLPLAKRAYTLAANAETSLWNRAASVWGYVAFLSGDPQGLIESEAGAKAIHAEALTSPSDLRWSLIALSAFSIAATLAERFVDAEHFLGMLISAAENIGDTAGPIGGLAMTRAIVAARQGRLAEALGFAERASSQVNPLSAHLSQTGAIRAEVLHQIGRGAEAVEWCDRIEPDAASRGESSTLLRLWNVRGQRLLREGRSKAASELYAKVEELSVQLGIGEPCWIPWARHAITAHLSADRTPDVRRVIAWLDRCAAQLPCMYPRIAAATGRAALAEAEGSYERAESYLTSALALHESVGLPLEQVQTLLACGAFLRRRGRPSRARPLLAKAAAIAEAHQAGWLLEQVREELAAAGGRRRRPAQAGRLTIQEARVARRAAAGHSNKAIAGDLSLSVKTVEYHLQRVYAKLGINSRRGLMTGRYEPSRVWCIPP